MDTTNRMEIRKRIGQIMMFGFSGTELNDTLARLIREQQIGGVILFSENILDPPQLRLLCRNLQDYCRKHGGNWPLFIAIDQEGGKVSRIPWLAEAYPDPVILGEKNSGGQAFSFGYGLGKELSHLGINIDLAPVLDVLSNPQNMLLARRCLGHDPKQVAWLGEELIMGLHQGGVLATGKHFPGHGHVSIDSHQELPISSASLNTIRQRDLIPFIRAITSGLQIIMSAHVKYQELDPDFPASLSKKIISHFLRNQLRFRGLVITDDLLMKAITNNYSIEEAGLLAVEAGSDILLVAHQPDQQIRLWQTLLDHYHQPEIFFAIERASKRITQFKAKWQKILAPF